MPALAAKAVKDQRRKAAQLKLADNMTDQKQNRKQSLTSVTTMGSFDPEVWHHIADYLYSMIAAACYSQKKTNLIIVQEIAKKLRMFCRAESPPFNLHFEIKCRTVGQNNFCNSYCKQSF